MGMWPSCSYWLSDLPAKNYLFEFSLNKIQKHLLFLFISEYEKCFDMDVLVIEPNNEEDLRLIIQLAKKLGSKIATLGKEDVEDLALFGLMKKVKTGEKEERDVIMKKLKS